MPTSAKRSARGKRQIHTDGAGDDSPNTSPLQSAKRRKLKDSARDPPIETQKIPKTQADLDMSDEEIVTTVSQHLLMPEHFVQVAQDNSNQHHQKQSQNIAAYAKITGRDWTFYVKRLRTNIGRPPEGFVPPQDDPPTSPTQNNEGIELPGAPSEPSRIHVDLGPNKLVSRLHAEIYFDSDTSTWNIVVNGRNGIKINDQFIRRGQKSKLRSGNVIEIGGVEMMFVLPESDQRVEIQEKYLERASLIQPEFPSHTSAHDQSINGRQLSSDAGTLGPNGLPGQLPIAPAPPNYKRPDTPIKHRNSKTISHSPGYNTHGGTMLMSSDQIDLSLEQNNHIKPSYTYGQLIAQAIMASPNEQQTLQGIYKYCADNYSFYRKQENQKGWQNSIRHNLSLHNGFKLRPRESHEPGKGGWWSFKPDHRDALIADAWGGKKSPRRSPHGSVTPGSPGANGRHAHGPGEKSGGSPTRKIPRSPPNDSPISSYPSNGPQFTPDRSDRLPSLMQGGLGDGSPLPRRNRGSGATYGLSDNIRGSPPILSSSFAHEEGNSLITPAPVRKHPFLAPPSTAQRPSQHMPTSSPAPFWRFADLGTTPLRGFDISPTKNDGGAGLPQSSSPPPRADAVAASSPSKGTKEIKTEATDKEDDLDEEPAFDLTRGFMSISKFHATSNNGVPVASAATQGQA